MDKYHSIIWIKFKCPKKEAIRCFQHSAIITNSVPITSLQTFFWMFMRSNTRAQWRPICFLSKYFKISIKLPSRTFYVLWQIYLHNKNILKYVKVFFFNNWKLPPIRNGYGSLSEKKVVQWPKTLLPLKSFSYMTHSLPKATFTFYYQEIQSCKNHKSYIILREIKAPKYMNHWQNQREKWTATL